MRAKTLPFVSDFRREKNIFLCKKMAKRGETWSEKETSALIAIWANDEIQRKLSNTRKNSEIFKKISKDLKAVNGIERDYVQCRNKIKQLKSVYKKYKDSQTTQKVQGLSDNTTSEAGRKKPPKFFDDMDNFLNDKPDATGIANAIDTSDDTVNETEDESDVSVDIGKIIIIISFSLKVVPHGKCIVNLFKFSKMGPVFTVCYH